jgi:signal transduction histidine kinase
VAFFAFAFLASLWTFNNFFLRIEPDVFYLRSAYVLGLIVAVSGLTWASYFLYNRLNAFAITLAIPLGIAIAIPTLLTNGVIKHLEKATLLGYEGETGILFPIYSVFVSFIILSIIWMFLRRLRVEKEVNKKAQIYTVLFGVLVLTLVSLFSSLIAPVFFKSFQYATLDNLSFSIFLFSIFFATLKFRLFNLKIVATEIFIFILWIFILIRLILSTEWIDRIMNGVLFIFAVIIGLFLVRSVIQEVEQREEIQRLADSLKAANDKLKELDRLKSEFLSIATHDLRAPLSAIRNFMSLMLDGTYGKLPAATEEGMRQVFDRATEMSTSVDNYLNISRIEQGRMKYDFEYTDLKKIVEETAATFMPIATEKGLVLSLSIPPGLASVPVRGDVPKLHEVFNNLVDNSIKYTPKGEVRVVVEGGEHTARVIIQDTGVGMSGDTKQRLFKLFSPGAGSRKINPKSTGVGLYIAKKHVEAHKGTLLAESKGEGKGSRFIVELPITRPPAQQEVYKLAKDI